MATARLGRSSPLANCTLIARKAATAVKQQGPGSGTVVMTWAFTLERVTRIELALSAWEADVLPLNYTRAYEQDLITLSAERACTISAQTWYRNR